MTPTYKLLPFMNKRRNFIKLRKHTCYYIAVLSETNKYRNRSEGRRLLLRFSNCNCKRRKLFPKADWEFLKQRKSETEKRNWSAPKAET